MKAETERLELYPLSISQLSLLRLNSTEFTNQLNVRQNPIISPDSVYKQFHKSINRIVLKNVPKENFFWYTWWVGINKNESEIVTFFGFSGKPTNNIVEIGFFYSRKVL